MESHQNKNDLFKVDWVLCNELAIGPAPTSLKHIEELKRSNIKSIFSLCSTKEVAELELLKKYFFCKRYVLPDHRTGRLPTKVELNTALDILYRMKSFQPTFVHCVAGIERSPLVCLAWLIIYKNLNPQQALDYLMQEHPGTCPLPGQLELLKQFTNK